MFASLLKGNTFFGGVTLVAKMFSCGEDGGALNSLSLISLVFLINKIGEGIAYILSSIGLHIL